MTKGYEIYPVDGATVPTILDEMAILYEVVYSEEPYNSGSLWDRQSFIARTGRQSVQTGFSLFIGRSPAAELIGFTFGLPFDAGRWWGGNATKPPNEILAATKFAVIELIVRRDWRNRGLGHQLHDSLLRTRNEEYAILTALPAAPARKLYERWGWTQVGFAKHTSDSPTLDSLALPLGVSRTRR
jgi:GNAT superfamily N-acetyltransferase